MAPCIKDFIGANALNNFATFRSKETWIPSEFIVLNDIAWFYFANNTWGFPEMEP